MYNPQAPGGGQGPSLTVEQYDAYINKMTQFWQASTGFEKLKMEAQIKDAAEGRKNAIALEKMRGETSRYGIDSVRETAMAELAENARQYDLRHGLDVQKLGIDTANIATEYMSSPDRYFQSADFLGMAGRALGKTTAGPRAPQPYGSYGQPTPKTEADWQAFSAGLTPGTATGSPTGYHAATPTTAGVPGVVSAAAGTGAGSDARAKALKAMIDAVPPSQGMGLDDNDAAVLQAAKAMYSTNLKPGTYEAMRPGQRGIMESAGKRLGYDTDDWLASYQRGGIGQAGVRSY